MHFIDDHLNPPDPDMVRAIARNAVIELYTPAGVKAAIKQAVILCWLIQSEENRTPAHVGALARAALNEVLLALEADTKAFGVSALPPFRCAEDFLPEWPPPSTQA